MAVSTQVESLNRVRYGGLDFDTHFDDLRARTQVQFAEDFNDFVLSSLGIMLMDIVAYGLDSLSFYLDRRATDAYIDTARTRKAVARLSRQLGYKMGAAVSSSVDVQVAIQNPSGYAFSVPIPKGFQFKGPEDLIFETAEQATFDPLSGPNDLKTIPCYEGQTITENFVSNGLANQSFELRRVPSDKFVVQGTVQVVVNGSDWTESDFISFDKTNQFEVGYNDDPPTVRFGDGVAGNIPDAAAPIVVIYVAARGKAGQISNGTITDVVNPLVVNFTTIALNITNPLAPEGGDDPEAIAKVKVLAGRVFKSRQVAVTRSDYQALSGAFADPLYGRVAAAQAISSRSASQDIFLQNCIADIKSLIAPVKDAVNYLTKYSLTSLTGTLAFTNGGTAVGGVSTLFLSEVKVGQYIKKTTDADTLYVPVLAVLTNTSITLGAPYQGLSGTAAGVLNGPTGVSLLGILAHLSDIQTQLGGIGDNNTASNTQLTTALNAARVAKNDANEITNDASNIVTEAVTGGSEVSTSPTATANLVVGAGTSRVLYVSKVPGAVGATVRVQHVAGGSLSVAVAGLDITVTVAATSTATQVAAAVVGFPAAAALVEAYAYGGGAGIALGTFALQNLNYGTSNSIPVSGIPDTLQGTLQMRFDRCKTDAALIQTSASALSTALDGSVVAPLLIVEEKLVDSGLDTVTPGSKLYTATQDRIAINTAVGTDAPTGLYQTLANIDAAVVPIDTDGVVTNTVGEKLGGQGLPVPAFGSIYNHVDVLLSDDCKSNLVTVPILTHDAAGFYTEPSLGLQQALQSYLDARKEVTQTVKVTNGKNYLVRPVLVIRAGVKLGYSLSVTKTAISTAVDGILRDRDFGASMYLSDFCQVIDTSVAGLAFLNVTIKGYNDKDGTFLTDKLDGNGNLIINATEVITKEQRLTLPVDQAGVTISTEIVTPT
jgi:hypothetical protein